MIKGISRTNAIASAIICALAGAASAATSFSVTSDPHTYYIELSRGRLDAATGAYTPEPGDVSLAPDGTVIIRERQFRLSRVTVSAVRGGQVILQGGFTVVPGGIEVLANHVPPPAEDPVCSGGAPMPDELDTGFASDGTVSDPAFHPSTSPQGTVRFSEGTIKVVGLKQNQPVVRTINPDGTVVDRSIAGAMDVPVLIVTRHLGMYFVAGFSGQDVVVEQRYSNDALAATRTIDLDGVARPTSMVYQHFDKEYPGDFWDPVSGVVVSGWVEQFNARRAFSVRLVSDMEINEQQLDTPWDYTNGEPTGIFASLVMPATFYDNTPVMHGGCIKGSPMVRVSAGGQGGYADAFAGEVLNIDIPGMEEGCVTAVVLDELPLGCGLDDIASVSRKYVAAGWVRLQDNSRRAFLARFDATEDTDGFTVELTPDPFFGDEGVVVTTQYSGENLALIKAKELGARYVLAGSFGTGADLLGFDDFGALQETTTFVPHSEPGAGKSFPTSLIQTPEGQLLSTTFRGVYFEDHYGPVPVNADPNGSLEVSLLE